jgi:hypothetical protein
VIRDLVACLRIVKAIGIEHLQPLGAREKFFEVEPSSASVSLAKVPPQRNQVDLDPFLHNPAALFSC